MRRLLPLIASTLPLLLPLGGAAAQTCSATDVAAVVEDTGARLRAISSETQPKMQARMRQLAKRQGWSDAEAEDKGYAFLTDDETQALDEQASQLLLTFDHLGRAPPSCAVVGELKTTAAQLIEITTVKSAHISARLDAALRTADAAPQQKTAPAAPSPASSAPPAQPAQVPAAPAEPAPKVARTPPQSPSATPPAPVKPKQAQPWLTETTVEATSIVPKPEVLAQLPPRAPELSDLEFTAEDIAAAGRGFFGSISAGLASVIEFAFQTYGRPTGYILGQEGGGALLAGLRYGDGTLVMKASGERKVYWQGPSLGYDFGIAGSRVMFLVYNVREPEMLYERFGGVDGSAYLVGGVGITFLNKGRVVLAPIRTGLGLRLGANVGYLKFTPRPSLNPF